MSDEVATSPLQPGFAALAVGDFATAAEVFSAALQAEPSLAEALAGLADAEWWLGHLVRSVELRERAYAEFRRRNEALGAAFCAIGLAIHHRANLGNFAAAAGWVARAATLVEELQIEPLRGHLLMVRAACSEDPVVAEQWAREAIELGRRSGDADLELCTLSQLGVALVQQGRVAEGVAALDEAMAGSLGGEGRNPNTVVFTSCNMIRSCTSCAEFERAVQWIRAAERFAQRFGCPFLYAECRTVYGRVLLLTGEWARAEQELTTALALTQDSVPRLQAEARALLAELRVAQGRLHDAELLLAGLESRREVAGALALVHLRAGRAAAAAAVLQSALQDMEPGGLDTAQLVELRGECELLQGDLETAAASAVTLTDLGLRHDCRIIRARGERLHGRVRAAAGQATAARAHLDVALRGFVELDLRVEAARTRMVLAEALGAAETETAVAEARAALSAFERAGAHADADGAASFLRTRGVRASRLGPRGEGTLTRREREILALLGEGLSNPEIAERLHLSRKTVEHHVGHVLDKLGLRSRAEAAVEVARTRAPESARK